MPKVVCLIANKISLRHYQVIVIINGTLIIGIYVLIYEVMIIINFAKRVLNIAENLIWLRRKLSVVELFCHFAKPEIDRDLRASQV